VHFRRLNMEKERFEFQMLENVFVLLWRSFAMKKALRKAHRVNQKCFLVGKFEDFSCSFDLVFTFDHFYQLEC
jgi:hypothetical protein